MTKQSKAYYKIWLSVGGFFLFINILKDFPMIIVYALFGIIAFSLLILFVNFLHTLYLINFNSKIKSILKFNEKESREYFENLRQINRTEKTEIDERYFRFIASSKIFDC